MNVTSDRRRIETDPLEARLLGMTLAATTQLSDHRHSQPTVSHFYWENTFRLIQIYVFYKQHQIICLIHFLVHIIWRSCLFACLSTCFHLRRISMNFGIGWCGLKLVREFSQRPVLKNNLCSSFRVRERYKKNCVRFAMKSYTLEDVTPYSLVDVYRRFGGTSVNIYQTTRYRIPKDITLTFKLGSYKHFLAPIYIRST
jgi:hypothetical protein